MRRGIHGKALLQLIDRCLHEGASIDIDGMGSFQLDENDKVIFESSGRGRVFLAYAQEDRAEARKLYAALRTAGFEPWMDEAKLLPGQNWPRAIERAIEVSDFFVGCFSRRSAAKRGHFQCELAYALDIATRIPEGDIFLIPVRLNSCDLPSRIAKSLQFVDLFPDWDAGIRTLVKSLRQHSRRTN